jgi:hypothetical protein
MSLEDLTDEVQDAYAGLDDEMAVELDRETKNELAMLAAAMDTDEEGELLRRGVHLLFQTAVETGQLDFHLRTEYDATYDEYLSGMTYEEMTGGSVGVGPDDDDHRRYQF